MSSLSPSSGFVVGDAQALPPLLSMRDVCRLTTLSRTAINKARKAGRFPAAVNLDGNRLAFVSGEVLEWISERIEKGRQS